MASSAPRTLAKENSSPASHVSTPSGKGAGSTAQTPLATVTRPLTARAQAQTPENGGTPSKRDGKRSDAGSAMAAAASSAAAVVSRSTWRSWNSGVEALQPREKEIVQSSEVQRKATLAQLYFLNHYFDSLRYLSDRRARLAAFEQGMADKGMRPGAGAKKGSSSVEEQLEATLEALSLGSEGSSAQRSYKEARAAHFAQERELLRNRRTKLRLAHFHIVTQVGQGGYGEVFLARKRDSGELCALKRLRKRVLVKMDEVRHVLTERDILTATRSPWLVRLLYAFQDQEHVFLAMVRARTLHV